MAQAACTLASSGAEWRSRGHLAAPVVDAHASNASLGLGPGLRKRHTHGTSSRAAAAAASGGGGGGGCSVRLGAAAPCRAVVALHVHAQLRAAHPQVGPVLAALAAAAADEERNEKCVVRVKVQPVALQVSSARRYKLAYVDCGTLSSTETISSWTAPRAQLAAWPAALV